MAIGVDPNGQFLDPQLISPVRRNPLVNFIARLVVRNQPDKGPQPSQKDSTLTGTTAFSVQSIFDKYFLTDVERLVIYKDVQEMDEQSEEWATALDTIADNVCSSEDGQQTSIEVVVEDNKANDEVQKMLARVDLHHRLYSIVRNTLKFGDVFAEIVANAEADVVAIKQLPPNTIYRNEDKYGNLVLNPPKYDESGACLNGKEDCAFSQVDVQTQRVIAAFYPWQVIHFRHNWDGMSPYGRSLGKVTRVIWRKLKAEEEGMIIGRLTRAYLKLVHKVDTTGLSKDDKLRALMDYRDAVTQRQAVDTRREAQQSVMSDLFISAGSIKIGNQVVQEQTSVSTIDPKNEGLQNTNDLEFFHKKMLSTVRVPPAHMGFEKDVNAKATLTLQDVQYVRFLRRVQSEVGQCLEQMINVQLILKGFDPKQVKYLIRWPVLSATDEAVASLSEMQRATADQVYKQEGVLSSEWIQRSRFGMDDIDIEEIKEQIAADDAREQQQAAQQAQQQIAVKTAQAAVIAKNGGNRNGGNNGGDTTRGNPPPGGRSQPNTGKQPEKIGVNPPTTRALKQEDIELAAQLAMAVVGASRPAIVDTTPWTAPAVDPLLERAQLALDTPAQVVASDPSIHVHLDEGLVKAEHHTHVEMPTQPAPQVHVEVKPEVKAPDVHVEGDHIVVEQPLPIVVPPATVEVNPAVKPPDIVIQPSEVKVEVIKEQPKGEVEIVQETDKEGRKVHRVRRKEQK